MRRFIAIFFVLYGICLAVWYSRPHSNDQAPIESTAQDDEVQINDQPTFEPVEISDSEPSQETIFDQLRKKLPKSEEQIPWGSPIRKLFSDEEVHWLADNFGYNALKITEKTGAVGAFALQMLGSQGLVLLKEKNPDRFETLLKHLSVRASASLLYFLNMNSQAFQNEEQFEKFLNAVEGLTPDSLKLIEEDPFFAPFLVVAEKEVLEALRVDMPHYSVCKKCFSVLDLSLGKNDLVKISEMIKDELGDPSHKEIVQEWVELRHLDGLLLAHLFPKFVLSERDIKSKTGMELPVFLSILNANQTDILDLFQTNEQRIEERLFSAFHKLQDADEKLALPPEDISNSVQPYQDDLLALASRDEHTIRFILEKEEPGIDLIKQYYAFSAIGMAIPTLLIEYYSDDAALFENAFQALKDSSPDFSKDEPNSPVFFTLFHLRTSDPNDLSNELIYQDLSQRFKGILKDDSRVVAYIAKGGLNSDNYLRNLEQAQQRNRLNLFLDEEEQEAPAAIQAIPGYDICRLAWLIQQGATPSGGEIAWAILDGTSFIPLGKVISSGGKIISLGKNVSKKATKEVIEDVGENLIKKEGKNLRVKFSSEKFMKATQDGLLKDVTRQTLSSPSFLRTTKESIKSSPQICAHIFSQMCHKTLENCKFDNYLIKNFVRDWAIGYGFMNIAELISNNADQIIEFDEHGALRFKENATIEEYSNFLSDKVNQIYSNSKGSD